ncbi:hypothetical protein Dshi_3170 [Dinoroseobacter shibae DFL 12 = DSM 16493]|jgi:hypothetical protein|uniref:NnrT protein n=1 Tax=Dinoroseobacter shibae (strain DSM 16493 / NCIMB 14021 / DFL 12) TaxID=398580 RepID=A8LLZ4_DINSH|nr:MULTISPECIES: hypothetical protein [Dinoroseobacter]TNY43296.1 hypothetical protein FGC30_04485 [Streptococcus pyogenes]ABV94903.1 hypothetical protein Dshi_3170 [Dinoroseobacter shibae DFL 12 = DSM 16493]MDD9717961.1 hypothetical protein [Dinoroseobacter sp. PD6]URF46324.1 hypothetical protein M8008_16310 [Dinoroseobacter shibae]URF50630.1 hypothetical protein M8007_16310 [Dinoroseobacter shibae]
MNAQNSSDAPWPVWKLAVLLYPLAAGAVAVNLFMLALMGRVFGIQELSPVAAVLAGLLLGIPAAWATGKWIRRLMDEADGRR